MKRKGIYYAGDIHGVASYVADIDRKAVENGIETVIQVGDFGAGWNPHCSIIKYFEERERKGAPGPTWYTCGGNHDNWVHWEALREEQNGADAVRLAPGCFYVPRGTVLELDQVKHIFFGGAESIDKHMRTDGVDWWKEETPSRQDFEVFFDSMDLHKPEVVVAHEAPLRVDLSRPGRDSQPTPRNLENILRHCDHTPTHWYYGHHHCLNYNLIGKTTFVCCGLHGQFYLG